jgi:hypothetical protein
VPVVWLINEPVSKLALSEKVEGRKAKGKIASWGALVAAAPMGGFMSFKRY